MKNAAVEVLKEIFFYNISYQMGEGVDATPIDFL